MLLTDIVVDGIPDLDWTLHIPLMLHILFVGLDHTRPIVRDHCKQLLINLLVCLSKKKQTNSTIQSDKTSTNSINFVRNS